MTCLRFRTVDDAEAFVGASVMRRLFYGYLKLGNYWYVVRTDITRWLPLKMCIVRDSNKPGGAQTKPF